MQGERQSLDLSRALAVALTALLGATGLLAVAGPGASGAIGATAAKKCKKGKKGKKGAAAARKKRRKCTVKRVVLPLPAPVVRGTLSWTTPGADLDLHVFDANGAHSGLALPGPAMTQGIPDSVHSPDVQTAGSETFTDNVFQMGGAANREFSYAVCFYGTASASFTGIVRGGQSDTVPLSQSAGTEIDLTIPGGPPVPPNACT